MALFCPTCANLLLTETTLGDLRLFCRSCPYVYNVRETFVHRHYLGPRRDDDLPRVQGESEKWKDVQQTTTTCPYCSHTKAYFMQLQTRSGDEPMTIFYRCVKCTKQWKE